MRQLLVAAAFCALLAAPADAATRACPTRISDPADIERAIKAFFAKLGEGDVAAAREMLSPDFHAFDAGRHFDRRGLLELVGGAQKKGVRIEWNVGAVETKADCDLAWAHWINEGSVEGTPTVWQESALLRRTGKGWRFEFLHSERIVNRPAS